MSDMTADEFAAELKYHGFRIIGKRIASDDCPGETWPPATRSGRIDRARTLRKVLQERRKEIIRQALTSMA
jgi:hypothetical protein